MKKVFLFLLIVFSVQSIQAQFKPKVDERFELTSTVFALAGVPEYCQCAVPSYWQDMLTEFKSLDRTEPIDYIRELNQVHGIGYNAVSTTAEMLEIKNGKIRLQPQYDISKISEADSRWSEELFAKYIKMLNVFYKQSNFHRFFEKHRGLYDKAEERMNLLLEKTANEWFESFFGKPLDPNLTVYVSLSNGRNNYSMNNGVLIGMTADKEGLPDPDSVNTMYVLVHEFAHHYTNPLFFEHWPEMEDAANKMYPYVKEKMAQIAYGSAQTTFCEWMNNLFVLMYLKETDNPYLDKLTKFNTENGFIWMKRSLGFMDNFYARRGQYPHIQDFMPQLIDFMNYTADNYDFVIDEYEHRNPYIVSVYPLPGSDISKKDEIVITFSEPMLGSYGFNAVEQENVMVMPFEFTGIEWSDDYRQFTIKFIPQDVPENCLYGIRLLPKGFISSQYFPLDSKCQNLIYSSFKEQ